MIYGNQPGRQRLSGNAFQPGSKSVFEVTKMFGKLKMKVDEIDIQKIKVRTELAAGSYCVD